MRVYIPSGIAVLAPGKVARVDGESKTMPPDSALGDTVDGGRFKVIGTVAVAGTPDIPVARRVVLFNARSRRPARATMSSPAGNYTFNSVARGPWFVVSFDHTGEYNAVIADNILGEPI